MNSKTANTISQVASKGTSQCLLRICTMGSFCVNSNRGPMEGEKNKKKAMDDSLDSNLGDNNLNPTLRSYTAPLLHEGHVGHVECPYKHDTVQGPSQWLP